MTEAELLQAVQEALASTDDPEGFYTTEDWCDLLGLREDATRKRLKKLLASGNLELGSVRRVDMKGVETPRAAYRFKP
jgi:hypothetical protein